MDIQALETALDGWMCAKKEFLAACQQLDDARSTCKRARIRALRELKYPTADEIFRKRVFLLAEPTSILAVERAHKNFQVNSVGYAHRHHFDITPYTAPGTVLKVFNDEGLGFGGATIFWLAFPSDGGFLWFDERGFSSTYPSSSCFDYRLSSSESKWLGRLETLQRRNAAAKKIQRAVREWFCHVTYRSGRKGLYYGAAKASFEHNVALLYQAKCT
jgi:hypothetical protein